VITGSYNRAVSLIVGVWAAVGLLLRLYQLSKPGFLLGVTQYDDGVLFGNAVRLAQGVIPYRDFIMVQPPGSMLLMAPVALFTKVTGTAWGLALARILTVCADTACIVLLGLLTRHRGRLAVAIACGVYAVYPGALVASSTFLLEPWLNVCCLAAALLIFDGDRFAGDRRLALGGAVFGFAVSIKLWAAVPLLILGLLLAAKPRRLGLLAGGALAGLAVPVLPFLLLAPGQLVSQVITSQFLRSTLPHPLLPRLADMAGLSLWPGLPQAAGTVVVLAVTVYLMAGYLSARRPPAMLDRYVLASLAATVVMFLLPWEYYSHYAAFAVPFGALTLALPAGLRRHAKPRLAEPRQAEPRHQPGPGAIGLMALPACAVAVTALIAATGLRQVTAGSQVQEPPGLVAAVERLIPAGACVITNDPALTIVANRFIAAHPGCPAVVDTYGTLLAMTGGRPQSAPLPALRLAERTWQRWFHQATYVWLGTADHGLPWVNSLYNYLGAYFHRVPLAEAGPIQRGGLFFRASTVTSHRRSRRAGGARRSPRYR
jgi:alpha-1,2-mannosyltransferase